MAVTITGARTRTLSLDNDGDNQADSGDQFNYEVIVTNSGDQAATDVELDADENGYTIGNVLIGPIGVDDDLNAIYGTVAGNTPLTFNASDILGNDLDPDDGTPSLAITQVNGSAFGNGAVVDIGSGTLTNNGDGTITFRPDAGFEGDVDFTYDTVDSDGIASVAATPASVNITVGDAVWYVDSTGGSDATGDGTFENPFASLAPITTGGSSDALDDSNDTVFVYANGANAYNSGIVLEQGQILRGEGVAADFVVNGITISSVQADTQIEYQTFGAQLNSGNTIMGIDFVGENVTGVAIVDGGISTGNLTVSDVEVDGVGQIVDIDNGGALAVTFQSVTSHASSGVGGVIDLDGVTGSFAVTGFTTLDNASGTHNQVGIDIGGTVGTNLAANFAGGTSLNMGPNGSAAGVNLGTNAGSTNFAGLAIATQTANGFVASNAGTLTVTGAGNSVTTTTGQILSITNTLVGGTDVSFNVLSASGVVTGNAITLSNVDNNDLNISNVTLIGASGATGDGINVNTGSSTNVLINTANINNTAGDGIEINASTGTFQIVTGNIGNLNDPGGDTVRVIGGTGAVDIDANLSKSSAGNVVEVDSHTTGTVNFGGTITSSGGGNNGILLNNNSGNIEFVGTSKVINTAANTAVTITNNTANVSFQNGGLDIDTTTGGGIAAGTTGVATAGTLSITGTGNSVTSTSTGIPIVINGTDVGASGITLQSVSSNGAANGIFLQNTGNSGSFNVTGQVGVNNSGGTITNTGGTNDGIFLNNASNVNLTEMLISNTGGHGINAQNLGGANTLSSVTIQDYDFGNLATKSGVFLVNLNTNMTSMIVTNSTFNGKVSSGDGFFMEAQGSSSMNLRIENSIMEDAFSDGVEVQTTSDSTGTVNVRIWDNTFQNAAASGIAQGGLQMDILGNANFFADVDGNTFVNILPGNTTLGAIGFTNGGTADADVTIRNNIIHDIGGARGITATADGTSITRMRIDNNQIYDLQENDHGINFNMQGSATGNVIIENNQLGQTAPLWDTPQSSQAILVQGLDDGTVFALIQNNTIDANGTLEIVRVRATETADVDATIINNNIDDTDLTSFAEIGVATGTGAVVGGNIDVTITGNNVNNGVIRLDEGTAPGDIDVVQASGAAIQAANTNVATVTVTGTPDFSQPAPTAPTAPTLPSAPLLADTTAPEPAGDSGGTPDSGGGATAGDDMRGDEKGSTSDPTPDPTPDPQPEPSHPVIVDDNVLSQAELDYLVEAAIQRWADAGATAEQLAAMRAASFDIADMNGNYLASSQAGAIQVDSDGAGHGWFLDGTPGDNDEYEGSGTRLTADAGGAADGKMDLLTVLMHELGHQVGLDDLYLSADADELMYGYASVGTRRLPAADDLEGADLGNDGHTSYVVLTPTIGTLPADRAVRVVYTATINDFDSEVVASPFSNNVIVQGTNFSDVPLGADSTAIDTLSLGDLVFLDSNGNQGFDSGTDAVVQNVAVSLYADANNDGTPDGAAIATDTTDASGLYRFDNLAPGTYIVALDASNFAGGGALEGQLSVTGGTDPDDDVNNDDNGVAGTGALAGAIVAGSVTLTDDGEVADDGTGDLDYNDTVDFGFVDVNQTPENTVPGTQTIDEDTTVTFSTGGGNLISVNDPDVGGGDLTVTLSMLNGQLTLNGTAGLTFSTGDGLDDTTMTFSGTQAAINAALDGLLYEATLNENGSDTLTITTNDQGNTGVDPGLTGDGSSEEDTDTVTITINPVNDTPVVTMATPLASDEQVFKTIDAAGTLADIDLDALNGGNGDYGGSTLTVERQGGANADDQYQFAASGSFTVNGGNLEAGGLVFASFTNSGGTLTISFNDSGTTATGALADAVLQAIQYRNNNDTPPASINLDITLDDGAPANAGQGDTASNPATDTTTVVVNITDAPENVAPTLDLDGDDSTTLPGETGYITFTYTENDPVGVLIADSDSEITDADAGDSIESATITVQSPVVGDELVLAAQPGFIISGSGTDTLTITGTGTADQYEAMIEQVRFLHNGDNPGTGRTIAVVVNDGDADSNTALAATAINDFNDNAVSDDDAFTTDEATAIGAGLNLFNDNGSGADTDPEGDAFSVTEVNGVAASVGTQITLASGALLTVNADGTFDYDPNGAFDTTPAPVGTSGASNTPDSDTFDYTLTGGDTATVTITIDGLDTNDSVLGTAGVDTLDGGVGSDAINGLAGADDMTGGTGDDDFFVDDAGDVLHELAGEGTDRVFSTITFTLASDFENLVLLGSGNINGGGNGADNIIFGNSGNNLLNGLGGADTLRGDGGDDVYIIEDLGDKAVELAGEGTDRVQSSIAYTLLGNVENLFLTGTANINGAGNGLDNAINGNSGNNILNGFGGADTMKGGNGDDIYVVDNVGDTAQESSAAGGTDRVQSSVSFVLSANVENLFLSGSDNINATGNSIVNQLNGNAGNNTLDGKAGADIMRGGDGNDIYIVDNAGDAAQESSAAGGTDEVKSSVGYTIGNNVENLTLTGAAAIDGTGNALANILAGNGAANVLRGLDGADTLNGGNGNDSLYGGLGNDVLTGGGNSDGFYFDSALDAANNVDQILDYSVPSDTIFLENAVFTGLAAGALGANAFVIGSAAGDADDRIIYDSATGALYFDADGNGGGAQVQFATLATGLAMTANEFTVI